MKRAAVLPQQLCSLFPMTAFMVSHRYGLVQNNTSVVRISTGVVLENPQSPLTATPDISTGMNSGVTIRSLTAAAIIAVAAFHKTRQYPSIAMQALHAGRKVGRMTRNTGAVWR